MSGVAVVIPLYNHEAYIGRAIESVLNQTSPIQRVVIVDDGSTDGSVEEARKFKDSRIEIVTQKNAGAHAAINRAVSAASGSDYVSILNSDDYYHPRRIELCLASLEGAPGLQLVCSRLELVDARGDPLAADEPRAKWFNAVWSLAPEDLDVAEWLGIANFAGTTSNLVGRREYFLQHPFRPYRYVHDYYLLVLAALHSRLGIVEGEPLLSYRVHPANTITTEPENLVREVLRMNIDLTRAVAHDLRESPELRKRFVGYMRSAWSNVSSFREDLYQYAAASALAELEDEKLDGVLEGIREAEFPEVNIFPNKALVNRHEGLRPLGPTSGLAEKYAELKNETNRFKEERAAAAQHLTARMLMARSRWMAVGALLGVTRRLHRDEGKSAEEKLASLKQRLRSSAWVKLGRTLGSTSAKKLLE